MSIAESSSEAHTLMEPVIKPVRVFRAMRKAAAATESRAAEALSLASEATAPAACVPTSCIVDSVPDCSKSVCERVRVFGDLLPEPLLLFYREDGDPREDEQRRDRVAQPRP